MDKIITLSLIALALIVSLIGNAQEYSKKDFRKIHKFLIEFDRAAVNKDTIILKKMIYPFYYEGENIQEQAIDKVLLNDESCTIDYCYSHKAFSIIKDSLYSKFSPMKDDIREVFNEPIEAKKIFDQFSDEELPLFLYDDAIVVLVMKNIQIQLFFWEGINNLHQ